MVLRVMVLKGVPHWSGWGIGSIGCLGCVQWFVCTVWYVVIYLRKVDVPMVPMAGGFSLQPPTSFHTGYRSLSSELRTVKEEKADLEEENTRLTKLLEACEVRITTVSGEAYERRGFNMGFAQAKAGA